jgi:hypothetical protein
MENKKRKKKYIISYPFNDISIVCSNKFWNFTSPKSVIFIYFTKNRKYKSKKAKNNDYLIFKQLVQIFVDEEEYFHL